MTERYHFGNGLYTEFDGTYHWLYIPDEQWLKKECLFYYDGIPIYTSWTLG